MATSKVKKVLTGLPASDAEIEAVSRSPSELRRLIDGWIETPELKKRLLLFFLHAFQQTNTNAFSYELLFGDFVVNSAWYESPVIESVEDSFPRTALAIVEEGRPFNEVVTTDRFMLNPPLMALLAFLDSTPRSDKGSLVPSAAWPVQRFPDFKITLVSPYAGPAVPLSESLNPLSPSYLQFFDPRANPPALSYCKYPSVNRGADALKQMMSIVMGGSPHCGWTYGAEGMRREDFQAWRSVRVRQAKAGEEPTRFWDLAKLRDPKTDEIVVLTPRIGFMTTLAFFANWPTNSSNAARVTVNQALIVALGRSFDDRGATVQVAETADEGAHIQPGTTCFGCHQTLDPMRDFFRQSYNLSYYRPLPGDDPKGEIPKSATFAIAGPPPVSGNGIAVFAQAVANHPLFATAWTQKLCELANGARCDEDDPEFQRVAQVFRTSRYNFKALVRELFSSPLVTLQERTVTAEKGGSPVSIARREVFCASLENRLGLANLCGLQSPRGNIFNSPVRMLVDAIPGAGYARAEPASSLPNDPNVFYQLAIDSLCQYAAAQVVDGPKGLYSSKRKDEALDGFVGTVMGVPPGDPRAPKMRQLLSNHVDEAVKGGALLKDALQSAFIVACTSPPSASVGL